MSFLDVKTVTKRFGENTAVNSVSLSLEAGQILCLLGPSGCGKTTLLRLIAGLEQPDSGEIWTNGRNVTSTPPHKRGFGMMFQDYALFPHKNVQDNIKFGLEMRADPAEAMARRVAEMLDLVDLERFGEREVAQLSGGEQQRVALARALAPDPKLLLLDEPLGALDRALRERLMIDLRDILKRLGVTAVYVTHDQTEALAIGDLIAVMNNGRIEQIGTPQTVYNQPNSPFVARFLGFQNVIEATAVSPNQLQTPIGTITVEANLSVGSALSLLIKPDEVDFSDSQLGVVLGENEILVEVTHVGFYGRFFQLIVQPITPDGERLGRELVFEVKTAVYQKGQRLVMRIVDEALVVIGK